MTRPVRIVHVIQSVESGGAEQQLLALTSAQDWSRWQPFVVCTHEIGSLGPQFEAAGVPVEAVGKRGPLDIGLALRVARAVARHSPDIVHTWLASANFWGRVAARFLPGSPIVIGSERTIDSWISPVFHVIDRVLVRSTDIVIGNSSQVCRFMMTAKRLPADKVVTVRNGIALARAQNCLSWNTGERRAYRRRLGIPADAFVVGNISQPIGAKRLDLVVDVVARLRDANVPVRLLQLGRDPRPGEEEYFARYQRWLDERGVRGLVMRRGFVREVSPELAVMNALVQTSDVEGFPNAVAEALAMEVPVVATDAGGTSDMVIHRHTGWLVPPEDIDGLVEGLQYIYRRPDEAHRWGMAGRARVEKYFSVDTLVRNTTALYAALLRKRGRAAPG